MWSVKFCGFPQASGNEGSGNAFTLSAYPVSAPNPLDIYTGNGNREELHFICDLLFMFQELSQFSNMTLLNKQSKQS